MWNNWSKLFNNKTVPQGSSSPPPPEESEGVGVHHRKTHNNKMNVDYVQIIPYHSYEFQRAKQRASIKWLLSKAYSNKIPEEISDPFYKDYEGEEQLKPLIVQGLSNAELYCKALCNLYADPNFSQLSPMGIVQALARKGVYVQSQTDQQLTETILIQNTPLKITAHMALLESMMILHIKEIIWTERIVNVVQRFGPSVHPREMPADTEEALLLWINRSILAIKDYIQNNNSHEHGLSTSQVANWSELSLIQDFSDLSDGLGLCSLLAFYCQDEVALSEIIVPTPGDQPLDISESLWNLQLVQRVCDSLDYNVCHFTIEDLLYPNDLMKQNMLSFMGDLFNQLELHPSPNIKLLGSDQIIPVRTGLSTNGVQMRRSYVPQGSAIPDLRPSLYTYASTTLSDKNNMKSPQQSQSANSTPKRGMSVVERKKISSVNIQNILDPSIGRSQSSASVVVSVPVKRPKTPQDDYLDRNSEKSNQRYYGNSSEDGSEEFVVHRGRNVPTLSQVIRSVSPSSQDERSSPASRISMSRNTSIIESDDQNQINAAGKPSNWNSNKTSYAGRRSRRNSLSEADSQLTVENFGGSQDNLNRFQSLQRNPDKKPATVLDDSTSSPARSYKRQSSQEPSWDHYQNNTDNSNPTSLPPQQNNNSSNVDHQQQQNVSSSPRNTNSNSNNDGVFYGRRKYDVIMNEIHQNFLTGSNSPPPPQQLNQQFWNDDQNYNTTTSTSEGSPKPQFQIQSRNNPPNDGGNVTVYVMNNENSGFEPQRSTSMTNLSRLSDLQNNRPVNVVYLQSGNSNPNNNHSNSNTYTSNNNGWQRPQHSQHHHQQQQQQYNEYHTLPSKTAYSSPQHQPFSGNYFSGGGNSQRQISQNSDDYPSDDFDSEDIQSQLANIRLKLEEKRKRIELEKGKMESIASKQQNKLGKVAYLKAKSLNKGKNDLSSHVRHGDSVDASSAKRHLSLKDLESKWLGKTDEPPCRTPEIENMDVETYSKSLAKMDTSLSELEVDINKLSAQQQQIQNKFFLHGAPLKQNVDTSKRKTWSDNNPMDLNTSSPKLPPQSKWSSPKQPFSDLNQEQLYNGEITKDNNSSYSPSTKPSLPPKPSGVSNVLSGTSGNSFRLHSNADTQGNRLFNKSIGGDGDNTGENGPTPPQPPPRGSKLKSQQQQQQSPAPVSIPDDMSPLSVSFVNDEITDVPSSSDIASISSSKKSLNNITSGSKTYRITPENNSSSSPNRPSANNLFNKNEDTSSDENQSMKDRGFYIALDNSDTPKRPKPPLRTKAPSKRLSSSSNLNNSPRRDLSTEYIQSLVDRTPISGDDERNTSGDSDSPYETKPKNKLVIDEKRLVDADELYRMEKKKELILMQSLKRQQQVEDTRRIKEMQLQRRREEEAAKAEEKERKREHDKVRKQAILDSYRMKKQEDNDKDGKGWEVQESTSKRFLRPKSANITTRQRPKTIHLSEVDAAHATSAYGSRAGLKRSDSQSSSTTGISRSYGKQGSTSNLYSDAGGRQSRTTGRDLWGSTSSLNQDTRRRQQQGATYGRPRPRDHSYDSRVRSSRNFMGSQDYLTNSHRVNSTSSLLDVGVTTVVGSNTSNKGPLDSDSGVGTCSPPARRSPSPSPSTSRKLFVPPSDPPTLTLPSPTGEKGPGSLPYHHRGRKGFDDGASDISVTSSNMDYSGLRLYKQPTAKSNRSIVLNAVEYCVFPGAVNHDAKMRVLDEINRSESKHFLVMFRDAGCQFRALYSYVPEREEVIKLYGVGPKQVNDSMFEKFFKYNSGGKCFSQIHTKHLTVTIDAFTIHNALWQGKRAPTTKTKDMALVI